MKPTAVDILTYQRFVEEFQKESDRGAAVLAGSFLENFLAKYLRSKMVASGTVEELFDGFGPFASFSQRIAAAYAFGFIPSEAHKDLGLIQKIRNWFAHHPLETTFSQDPIAGWCQQLSTRDLYPAPNEDPEPKRDNRNRFLIAVGINVAGWHNEILTTDLRWLLDGGTTVDIRQTLDVVGQLPTRARVFFDVWWIYVGADTKPLYLDTMKRYSEFFRFNEHAHLLALVMYLGQLFEKRTDTLNLGNVISLCEKASLAPEAIEAAREKLARSLSVASKIAIIRNKVLAHRDVSLSYEEVFTKAGITANELRWMTEVALEIVNILRLAAGLSERHFHPLTSRDTHRMLRALTEGISGAE